MNADGVGVRYSDYLGSQCSGFVQNEVEATEAFHFIWTLDESGDLGKLAIQRSLV